MTSRKELFTIQGMNKKKGRKIETEKDKEFQTFLKYLQEDLSEHYEKGMSIAQKSKERNIVCPVCKTPSSRVVSY